MKKLLNSFRRNGHRRPLPKKYGTLLQARLNTPLGLDELVHFSVSDDLRLPLNSQSVLSAAWHDIQIYYTYPRLDAEVSKHRNHLLKAPFCVHPKTGRVCVPVNPETIEDFDPEEVPTVAQLLHELDSLSAAATATEDSGVGEHHSG